MKQITIDTINTSFLKLPRYSFVFLRHGETNWNTERRLQGRTDVPLNRNGIRQAHQAAATLATGNFDVIVASPLRRAMLTAKIVQKENPTTILSREALVERDFGDITGLRVVDVVQKYNLRNDIEIHDLVPPNGESFEEMTLRFLEELSSLLHRYESNMLLIGHGGLFRSLMWLINGEKSVCNNATPYVFYHDLTNWTFREYDDPSSDHQ